MSQLSECAGLTFRCSSRSSRSSKSRESMRSDCASIPTRGSRLVGLLSMIMTRVSRSCFPPQEQSWSKNPQRNNKKHLFALCFLHIRNLAQNYGPFCSGPEGNVRRQSVPVLVSEQREGYGLFGFGKDAKLGGGTQPQAKRIQS